MATVVISGFTDEEAQDFSTWLQDSGIMAADDWFEINYDLGLIKTKGFSVKKVTTADSSLIEIQVESIKTESEGEGNDE